MPRAIHWRTDDARISLPVARRSGSRAQLTWAIFSLLIATLGSLGWVYHRRQVDFEVYLMGARHLKSSHLYSLVLPGVHLPFTYPPFATLFFWPFTLVPTGVALVLWATLNLAALLAVLAVTLLNVRPEQRPAGAAVPWLLVAMLAGPAVLIEPVMLDLSFGQVNVVLLGIILLDLTTRITVGSREIPRGVGVGVAAAIKLVPVIFIPFLIVTRQFRAAATAVITIAVCALGAFAFNPSASKAYWTKYVNDQARIGNVIYVSNQSVQGALDRVTHHLWSSLPMESVQAVFVLVGIALGWWAWRSSSTFLGVLVVGDASLLASPITWAHHMVWIVPILLWLWWGRDRPTHSRPWALAVGALFYVAPMWILPHGPNFDNHERGWSLLLSNSFTLAALLMMIVVTAMLISRRPRHSI